MANARDQHDDAMKALAEVQRVLAKGIKGIERQLADICAACEGTGKAPCSGCNGKGKTGGFLGLFARSCVLCDGTGEDECSACEGVGNTRYAGLSRALSQEIPKAAKKDRSSASLDALLQELDDAFSDSKKKAILSELTRFEDPRATEALLAYLDSYGLDDHCHQLLVGLGEAVVPTLIGVLAGEPGESGELSDGAMQKARIATILSEIGDQRAIKAIEDSLASGGTINQYESGAAALESFGWQPSAGPATAGYWAGKHDWKQCASQGECAVAPLMNTIRYTHYNITGIEYRTIQAAAATALVEIGDPGVAALVDAMTDSSSFIREAAAVGLNAAGWAPGEPAQQAALLLAAKDWDGCVALGAPAVPALLGALSDSVVREDASQAISRIGAPAQSELVAAIRGGVGAKLRAAAAKALEGMGWSPADEAERWAMAVAKGDLQDYGESIEAIRALLVPFADTTESDWDLRKLARGRLRNRGEAALGPLLEALADIGDPRAVEPLIKHLGVEADLMRARTVSALGKIGDDRAVGPCVQMLTDEDDDVRKAAAESLGLLGDASAVQPLLAALESEREYTDCSETAHSLVLGKVIEALGKLADERAVPILIRSLRGDPDWSMRLGSAEALEQIGHPDAIDPLVEALKDSHSTVRWYVAHALGVIGDERALRPLAVAEKLEDEGSVPAARPAIKKIQMRMASGTSAGAKAAAPAESVGSAAVVADEANERSVGAEARSLAELVAMIGRGQPVAFTCIADASRLGGVGRYFQQRAATAGVPELAYYVLKQSSANLAPFPVVVATTGTLAQHHRSFSSAEVLQRVMPGASWADLWGDGAEGRANFADKGCYLASLAPFEQIADAVKRGAYELCGFFAPSNGLAVSAGATRDCSPPAREEGHK